MPSPGGARSRSRNAMAANGWKGRNLASAPGIGRRRDRWVTTTTPIGERARAFRSRNAAPNQCARSLRGSGHLHHRRFCRCRPCRHSLLGPGRVNAPQLIRHPLCVCVGTASRRWRWFYVAFARRGNAILSGSEDQHAKSPHTRYRRRTDCRRHNISGHKAQSFEESSVGRAQQSHKVACEWARHETKNRPKAFVDQAWLSHDLLAPPVRAGRPYACSAACHPTVALGTASIEAK